MSKYDNLKVIIGIPAYNEEKRIAHTVQTYIKYFKHKPEKVIFLVVANNNNSVVGFEYVGGTPWP